MDELGSPDVRSPRPQGSETPNPQTERRLQELMREVDAAVAPPRQRSARRGGLLPSGRRPMDVVLGIGLALLVGIQLGALPWRFRRELWQAQGALIGFAAGVLVGPFTAATRTRAQATAG